MLPDARTATLPDSDLLAFGDGQLRELIVPRIMACREDFFLDSKDFAITAAQQAYRVPPRALGRKLRDVRFIDATGKGGPALRLIPVEELDAYAGLTGVFAGGCGICLDGDVVKLVPTPSTTSGTLRMRYYRFPSTLVAASAGFVITGMEGTAVTGNVPTSWTTADTFDLTMSNPGFDLLGKDLAAGTVTAGTSIVLSATPSSELAIGDYVTLAMQTAVPHLPMEWHGVLAQAIAVKACEALKDAQGMQFAQAKLDIALGDALKLLAPRVDAHPKKVGGGSGRGGVLRNKPRGRFWP